MTTPLNPIQVPANPFWTVLRTFGRDEFIAGVISIIITAGIEGFFWLRGVPPGVGTALMLAFAGPVFEKIGFFVGHIRDAAKVYNETPIEIRKPRGFYIKKAFQGGTKSLIEDVLVHDPIYAGLMLGGMKFHPETPVFLLVPIAFGLAVVVVAFLEVAFHEFRYWRFQRQLFAQGFAKESYLESRLYLDASVDSDVVLQLLQTRMFPNSQIRTLTYNDIYCVTDEMPEFNARIGKIRVRNRSDVDPERKYTTRDWVNTIQLVYTRAIEASEEVSQFRYFPMRKDKFYRFLEKGNEEGHQEVGRVREAFFSKNPADSLTRNVQRLSFIRQVIHKPELLVSVDTMGGDAPVLVEIKAYPQHVQYLKEALRLILHHFPATQVTHGKSELVAGKVGV